ncbi:hypothetical protein [Arthrobacter castelli]|uniref:hypothetical protein n=1 Tax=Arthrobacter castelli TaxID=271431 RepID=UPI0004796262|nr:hypothetical protein [Arthrobacter castelli]
MQIEKSQIIDLLNSKADDTQGAVADSVLPETVDTDKDAVLLAKFGLDPQDLEEQLGRRAGN